MKKILTASILICGFNTVTAVNQNTQKLNKINHSIADIQAELDHDQKLRKYHEKNLRAAELSEATIANQLNQTEQQLNTQQQYLNKLRTQTYQYENTIDKLQTHLIQQIQAAYMLPRYPLLKLLLDQYDAITTARMRMYYHYIAQNEATTIQQLRLNLRALTQHQLQIKHQSKVLQTLQTQQKSEHDKLESAAKERLKIIQEINKNILTKNQRLTQLIENKKTLERMIAQLQKPEVFLSKTNFQTGKGKLPWPVQGKIINKFGTQIEQSELRWNGIVLSAPINQPIHAIADGRVIFADWLAGYGLLLIINHGNGYMSLYGRNQNLTKHLGDFVKQGDVIATVGKTGGYNKPGLYFEMRHNIKPLDPTQWCHPLS